MTAVKPAARQLPLRVDSSQSSRVPSVRFGPLGSHRIFGDADAPYFGIIIPVRKRVSIGHDFANVSNRCADNMGFESKVLILIPFGFAIRRGVPPRPNDCRGQ
jgi:hypothetical protein